MPGPPRRAAAVLLAIALASMLLLGSGTALAAGSNGSNGSNGSSGSSGSKGGSSGGQAATLPSSGSGPLSPGLSAPGTPTPTTATQTQTQATNATTTAAGGGGSLSSTSVFGIAIGAVIVIGGVCVYIFRDAGRRAAVRGRRADAAAGGSSAQPRVPGSKRVKPRKLSPQERRRRKRGRAPRRK